MKYLLDISEKGANKIVARHPEYVAGQLLTPLTRYSRWSGVWAMDNGCFRRFEKDRFLALLDRESDNRQNCLFVCCPDVVANARRTLETFYRWADKLLPWPLALVAQDGIENLQIPWDLIRAVFIGGSDKFKDSSAGTDIVKTAAIMEVHSHVGRVNTTPRFRRYREAGADTCDGSGVCRFDHMLDDIAREMADDKPSLFDSESGDCLAEGVEGSRCAV